MADDAPAPPSYDELAARLAVAEQTLDAIHHGEVDALMISTPSGPRVYTLQGADEFYRAFVEQMGEGAIAVQADGTILFANEALVGMLGVPHASVVGSNLASFVTPQDQGALERLLGARGAVSESALGFRGAPGTDPVRVRLYAREVMTHAGEATLCLLVVDQTQHLRAEEAQRLAERAERGRVAGERRSFLAELTEALSSTSEPDEAMRRLTGLVVPRLGDWAVLTIREEDGQVRAAAWAHRDAACEEDLAAYALARAASMTERDAAALALGRGESVILTDRVDDDLAALVADPRTAQLARALRPSGAVVLPLVGRGQTFGELTLATTVERGRHTEEEASLALDVVLRAGPALDTARVAQRARHLAESMQRSLLTVPSPRRSLQIATRYRPAHVDREVGGDWFDSFGLPGGATAVSIGDVMGHDLAAIAAMAQLRTLMRASAWSLQHSPAEILAATDHANFGLGVRAFATAVAAEFEPATSDGSVLLRWSNAGHPPPLVVAPDGHVSLLRRDPVNIPLGVQSPARRDDHQLRLAPGSIVLFYTDGLVENRFRDLDAGLLALTSAMAGSQHRELDPLLDMLLGDLGGAGLQDDVALLAVRIANVQPARTTDGVPAHELDLPVDVIAPSIGRRHIAELAADLPPDRLDDLLLLASEVITNAVRYGAGPITLRTRLLSDEVEVSVRDHGSALPVLPGGRLDLSAPNGRGLLILNSLAGRWGITTDPDTPGKLVWFTVHRRSGPAGT